MNKSPIISKLGRPALYDPQTRMSLNLPDGLLVYFQTDRLWIGGSPEGRYYLMIERVSVESTLPTILSEGDLDLFLCTTSPLRRFTDQTTGASVTGTLSGRWIKGYLLRCQKEESAAFLILTVDVQSGRTVAAARLALKIAEQMSISPGESQPAPAL